MKLDTTQPGLSALFFPHQGLLLQRLFTVTTPDSPGLSSRELWDWLNEFCDLRGITKVSRATCIQALQALSREGILEFELETCKGGHRRLYRVNMIPAEFEDLITNQVMGKLVEIFKGDWWRTDQ